MTNYQAVILAARHASRRTLKLSSTSSAIIMSGAHRPLGSISASAPLASDGTMSTAASPLAAASMQIPMGAKRLGSTSSSFGNGTKNAYGHSFAALATAASLAVASSYTLSQTASCESKEGSNNNGQSSAATGLADESEDSNGANIIVQDGMDAGSEVPKLPSSNDTNDGSAGPADAEEDNVTTTNNNNDYVEEDDEDPSRDEDTSCSICLINRQGPCRKYWLKFERCMKEHGVEKDKKDAEKEKKSTDAESIEQGEEEEDDDVENVDGEESSMEDEWDAFMEKTVKPGEDDDEDDEDEDEDEDDDEDEEDEEDNDEKEDEDSEEASNNTNEDEETSEEKEEEEEDMSLAQRCDKFMIPWISCIQEHRNVYSLISNAFYQKDYIDPLEDTIPDDSRNLFTKNNAEIGEVDGYVMKFNGVEIDLGNWREHVEADADENGNGFEEEALSTPQGGGNVVEEPHLINAYAKFQLIDPSNGTSPIEVAYIKDQRGRLLGFDSFTKRDSNDNDGDSGGENGSENQPAAAASNASLDGECTFHIVPGETTSVVAYAIYRGAKKQNDEGAGDKDGEEASNSSPMREDYLYYTPEVPLPGVHNQKK